MLSKSEAISIAKKAIPEGRVDTVVEYKDLYLLQIFEDRPGEEDMDPYYSVNRSSGEFRDFSIITDGDPSEIADLFIKAKQGVQNGS